MDNLFKLSWRGLGVLLCLLYGSFAKGQTHLKLAPTTQMKATGATQIVLHNTSWDNDAQFDAGNSKVHFKGANHDSIKGQSVTTFHAVVLNKIGGGNIVQAVDVLVDDSLRFVGGIYDLNGFDLRLGSADGVLINESESSRILGPNGGEVIKTVNINAATNQNPGNLGAIISTSNNLQSVSIRRGHVPQLLPAGNTISRYYEIVPTNVGSQDATIGFSYFDAELNGMDESLLETWHLAGANWQNLAPNIANATTNLVEADMDSLGRISLGEGAPKLALKVFLQGAYQGSDMNDNLRANGLLPLTEPFSGLGYTHVGGGGETTTASVLSLSGPDAIVDWILIELRSKNDSSIILRTQSALLQRDGDIVGLDGSRAVRFAGIAQDDYFLSLKHRNHLGIRTPSPISLALIETNYDFSSSLSQAWNNPTINSNPAMIDVGGGVYALYRADANADNVINVIDFLLSRNNSSPNQSNLYAIGDLNLDGNINIVDFLIARAQSSPNKVGHN